MIREWLTLGKAVLFEGAAGEDHNLNETKEAFKNKFPIIKKRAFSYEKRQADESIKPTQRPIYNKFLSQLRAKAGGEEIKINSLLEKVGSKTDRCIFCKSEGALPATGWVLPSLVDPNKFPNMVRTASPKGGFKLCPACRRLGVAAYGGLLYWQDNDRKALTIAFPTSASVENLNEVLCLVFGSERGTELESNASVSNTSYGRDARGPYGLLFLLLTHLAREMKERKETPRNFGFILQEFISKGKKIYCVAEFFPDVTRLLELFNKSLDYEGENKSLFFYKNLDAPKSKDANRLREAWLRTLMKEMRIDWRTFEGLLFERIRACQNKHLKNPRMILAERITKEVLGTDKRDSYDRVNNTAFRLGIRLKEGKEDISVVFQLRQKRSISSFLEAINYLQLRAASKTNEPVTIDDAPFREKNADFEMLRASFLLGLTNGFFYTGGNKNE